MRTLRATVCGAARIEGRRRPQPQRQGTRCVRTGLGGTPRGHAPPPRQTHASKWGSETRGRVQRAAAKPRSTNRHSVWMLAWPHPQRHACAHNHTRQGWLSVPATPSPPPALKLPVRPPSPPPRARRPRPPPRPSPPAASRPPPACDAGCPTAPARTAARSTCGRASGGLPPPPA
ncbi:hypothetical protein BU14_1427s0002 [Porphyra umbilicalis]|uniref:Uncharacterized protein n=1 Tax=Porphyra umbilicalis TaxID=2786 RepID=A0A1X6NLQ2_PORUM|nr:hypothetical protein BU14_1427s0002 [Porphyra umbilicalis]|eukprot:OSX69528.1 hypothetical protein BU14_1427s0002 [Porphyra umbilicalis]